MYLTHILGMPKIGDNCQLIKAMQQYLKQEISLNKLEECTREIQQYNCQLQKKNNLSYTTVGDFAYIDLMLETSLLFGVIPQRFSENIQKMEEIDIALYLSQGEFHNHSYIPPLKTRVWFDTPYQYYVPELSDEQVFNVKQSHHFFHQINRSFENFINIKPVLIGPLTFLTLCDVKEDGFNKLDFLPQLMQQYKIILQILQEKNINCIQIDEPILKYELSDEYQKAFIDTYQELSTCIDEIILATCYGSVENNIEVINKMKVKTVHIDLCQKDTNPEFIISKLNAYNISLGIIDACNVWTLEFEKTIQQITNISHKFQEKKFYLATNASLMHIPMDVNCENKMSLELKSWFSFAKQKVEELSIINNALVEEKDYEVFAENKITLTSRANSMQSHNPNLSKKITNLVYQEYIRKEYFDRRQIFPNFIYNPLIFSITGKLPKLTSQENNNLQLNQELDIHIYEQEKNNVDLLSIQSSDVLDLYEKIIQNTQGFLETQKGWVQYCGIKCYKPAIIIGDIKEQLSFFANTTHLNSSKPIQLSLLGANSTIKLSYVHAKDSQSTHSLQLACVLNNEILNAQNKDIHFINIKEPLLFKQLYFNFEQKLDREEIELSIQVFNISINNISDVTEIQLDIDDSDIKKYVFLIQEFNSDLIHIKFSQKNINFLKSINPHDLFNQIALVFDISDPILQANDEVIYQILSKVSEQVDPRFMWIVLNISKDYINWFDINNTSNKIKKVIQTIQLQFENQKS